MKYLIASFLFIALQTSNCLAFNDWQAIGGNKLSYLLPNRQEPVTKDDREVIKDIARKNRFESSVNCRATANLLNKVFDRIVEKNNLQKFIEQGPGLGLYVNCVEYQAANSNGPAAGSGLVFMPAYIAGTAEVDDELAAAISHEISHVLLDHHGQMLALLKKLGIDPRDRDRAVAQPEVKALNGKNEPAADVLGALLMVNAGYNPKFLRTALEKLSSEDGVFWSTITQYLFNDGHGTTAERGRRIEKFIYHMEAQNSPGESSQELEWAKYELEEKVNNKNGGVYP